VIEFVRFFLSFIVLQSHIWPLNAPWTAWASVFAFYTLSGFLMTRVLRERYGFGIRNIGVFILNRVLRLWPAYLVVLGAIAALLLAVPDSGHIYSLLRLPQGRLDALANITVLGLVGFDFTHEAHMTLTVGNAWSLSIEMFCYLLLGLYFAQSPARLWAFAVIGLLAMTWSTTVCAAQGPDSYKYYGLYCFQQRYGVLQAGFIPFAIGGLLQFHIHRLVPLVERWRWAIVAVGLASFAAIALVPVLQFTIAPFVGSLLVSAAIAYSVGRDFHSGASDFFGRASYHLFIAQWGIAGAFVQFTGLQKDTAALCLATLIASLALSGVLVPLEHRVERLRRRLSPATLTKGTADFSGAPLTAATR
jgi:peptidoglycan/LPS O-acetylase OafA/YrhL